MNITGKCTFFAQEVKSNKKGTKSFTKITASIPFNEGTKDAPIWNHLTVDVKLVDQLKGKEEKFSTKFAYKVDIKEAFLSGKSYTDKTDRVVCVPVLVVKDAKIKEKVEIKEKPAEAPKKTEATAKGENDEDLPF